MLAEDREEFGLDAAVEGVVDTLRECNIFRISKVRWTGRREGRTW